MSKHNKVNPGQYYVAGRLTPDEMARERLKQLRVAHERVTDAPLPPLSKPRAARSAASTGAAANTGAAASTGGAGGGARKAAAAPKRGAAAKTRTSGAGGSRSRG